MPRPAPVPCSACRRAIADGTDADCDSGWPRSDGVLLPVLRRCSASRCCRAKGPSSRSSSSRSEHELRAMGGNLLARALDDFALRGVVQQRRVRIVDMQKYLSADIQPGEALDSAAVARHRNMSHLLSGLVPKAGRDQFVVAPHRAIEEDQRRADKARLQILIDAGAGGEEIEVFAASLVANPEPDCVARAVVSGGVDSRLHATNSLSRQ